MAPDIPWLAFTTELGLVVLSVALLVSDLFLKSQGKSGRTLARIAMAGVGTLFLTLCFQRNRLGTAFGGTLVQDGLGFFFKILFLLGGFLVLFMVSRYQENLKRGQGEFSILVLFALIGMVFVASANDFLLFFVALETLTLSLYIMTAYLKDKESSLEAGVKYLILGALSSAIFLYGLSFIYGTTGSTSYPEIQRKLALLPSVPAPFLFGGILVTASLGFKIAAVPFHLWAPDVYEGAPTPVTAYLAIGSKAAGFAALLRLMGSVFSPAHGTLIPLFGILAALTLLYGNLGAIPQNNVKRLLGYSSIGHAGYLLIGLAAFTHSGAEGILFYLLSYLFSTGGVFLVLVLLTRHLQTDEIGELAGLAKKSPMLAAVMLLCLLSLAGIPPLAGFFAKFYLLWASMKADLLWLTFLGAVNVIPSLYYYLRIVKVMYVDPPGQQGEISLSAGSRMISWGCVLGVLLLGIYPAPFLQLAASAFSRLP